MTNYNTAELYAAGDRHLAAVQEASGHLLRFYDDATDYGIPPTMWDQPEVEAILLVEGRAAAAEEAGLPLPDDVEHAREQVRARLEPKTLIVGAMVLAAFQASEAYRDTLQVRAPDTKTVDSAGVKIGRRFEEGVDRPISDFHRTMIVRDRGPGEQVDEAAEQDFMLGALHYLCEYFRVPLVMDGGHGTISEMGNPSSSSQFKGGKQAKLKFVIDNEVVLFEVAALTQEQLQSYEASHGQYEELRGIKRKYFRHLLLGRVGTKQLVPSEVVS